MTTIIPTCLICDEKVKTNKKNKFILCPYCKFQSCRKCCETYLLGEPVEKCMNIAVCGKPWTRSFLTDAFPKSFVYGSLKEHKKKFLFERERSMLPATQPLVEEVLRKERIRDLMEVNYRNERDATKELRKARRQLLQDIQEMEESEELREKIVLLREKKTIIERELNKIEEKYHSIERSLRIELGQDKKETVVKMFVRACPNEECRGFLSSQWKCGICDKSTCPQCHVVKGMDKEEEHTCDPDNVATAQLISSDTKPCPKCQTGIFKIDGCDQMFCTQCHTGFSWKTGHIQTRIHNPHYFEWMYRNPTVAAIVAIERNPLDVLCGREIDTRFVVQLMSLMKSKFILVDDIVVISKEYPERLCIQTGNIARLMIHMREVEIPKFAVDDVIDNQDLRVQYLLGKMDETAFKVELYRRFKKQDYKREHRDVLIMFRNTVTDILYRIMEEVQQSKTSIPSMGEMNRANPPLREGEPLGVDRREEEIRVNSGEDPLRESRRSLFSRNSSESQTHANVVCQTMMEEIESLIGYVNECLVTMAKTFASVPRIMKFTENYETMTIHYDYKGKK